MSALKLKKLTVIIASSFCFWNVNIASGNAATLTFTNDTGKEATDFHIMYNLSGTPKPYTFAPNLGPGLGANNFQIVPPGGTFMLPEGFTNIFVSGSAEWSFAQGPNEPAKPPIISYNDSPDFDGAEPVPEPTTTFGSAICLGLGGWLKRKKLSHQNKTTSSHYPII